MLFFIKIICTTSKTHLGEKRSVGIAVLEKRKHFQQNLASYLAHHFNGSPELHAMLFYNEEELLQPIEPLFVVFTSSRKLYFLIITLLHVTLLILFPSRFEYFRT